PSRRDPEVNATALAKVRDDKTREAGDGSDGSWVAPPDLVPPCKEVFAAALGTRPTQPGGLREEASVAAPDLTAVAKPRAPTPDALGSGSDAARDQQAAELFTEVALADDSAEVLTLPAYERMP